MKPRIRPHPLYRGTWLCGGLTPYDWCGADSPKAAYDLWVHVQKRAARWVNGRYVA
jgi:hypothetical protein